MSEGGVVEGVAVFHVSNIVFILSPKSFLLLQVDSLSVLPLVIQLADQRAIFLGLRCRKPNFFCRPPPLHLLLSPSLPQSALPLHLLPHVGEALEVFHLHHQFPCTQEFVHAGSGAGAVVGFASFLQFLGGCLDPVVLGLLEGEDDLHFAFAKGLEVMVPSQMKGTHYFLVGRFHYFSLGLKLLLKSSRTTALHGPLSHRLALQVACRSVPAFPQQGTTLYASPPHQRRIDCAVAVWEKLLRVVDQFVASFLPIWLSGVLGKLHVPGEALESDACPPIGPQVLHAKINYIRYSLPTCRESVLSLFRKKYPINALLFMVYRKRSPQQVLHEGKFIQY